MGLASRPGPAETALPAATPDPASVAQPPNGTRNRKKAYYLGWRSMTNSFESIQSEGLIHDIHPNKNRAAAARSRELGKRLR
jgi:hypothetical protein